MATDALPDGRPLAGESIAVVGGGIGGLATAPYLAAAGADVTVLERRDRVGGVANVLSAEGFRFDTGPTWYLMPDVFERFFGHFDRSPGDYYDLRRLDPHYRIVWKDGDSVAVPDDPAGVREIFADYEDGGGEAFASYLETARESYEIGMERFVYEDRPRVRDFLDPDVARSAHGLTFLGSMADHVAEYVDEPKLRQLLQYTLVFLGGSPHNTPALYNLMAHVDFDLGVFYPTDGPDGTTGMYAVVAALRSLGEEYGVTHETDRAVTAIEPSGTAGDPGFRVDTEGGSLAVDRVVCDANPAHVERDLLPPSAREYDPDYWDERTYAPSAYLLYLGVEGSLPDLEHHTLVLPTDWDDHFRRIFEAPAWPDDPSYYLCVHSKTDDAVAPDGHHAVVVLVPIAPGLADDDAARARFREQVLDDLADRLVDLRDRIVVEREACVSEFRAAVNAPQGTALGLAHTLRQTGPLRPGHRSSAVDGLYRTGAYTTPGIGVPMCLISGEHTAAAVLEDVERGGRPPWPAPL